MIYICFADYKELCKKGVAPEGILKRGDKEFFESFVSIHIGASRTQIIRLDDSNVIYEFGIKQFKFFYLSRLLQYLYAPFYLTYVIWEVSKIAKAENIDLIRGSDPYWCGFIAFMISRISRIPFCVSLHADYDKRGSISKYGVSTTVFGSVKLGKVLAQFVINRADMIMPIRDSLAEWAVKNGASKERIRVIPHGIDLGYFKVPPVNDVYDLFCIEKDLKIISFVGRLSMENYVNDIIRLGALLGRARADFIIVLAGGGKEEGRLRNMISSDAVLNKTVKMVGFQKQELCFDLRKASTVSLCLMGGFSLIEACAAGRPVVSYDVEWHYELVKNKETGFLVKEHDIEALEKSVNYLLDNPAEVIRMGENAKKLAFERHDINITSEIKRSAYKELLSYTQ